MADSVKQTITIETQVVGVDEAKAKLTGLAQAQDGVAVSSNTMAKAQLGVASQLDRMVQRYDPLAKATADLARAQALVGKAMQQGVQGDYSSVLRTLEARVQAASKSNDNFAKSTGLAAYQIGNLRSQLLDVATSLQGGASPLTVLSQQGPQIFEALAGQKGFSAGLKDAAASAAGLIRGISPTIAIMGGVTAAVTAAAAAYARFSSNQRDLALGIAGSGRASGATVGSINRVADANTGNGLSAQAIRELSVEFARTGKIGAEMYGDLSRFTKDYATLTGSSLSQAGQDVAQAFASQSAGALKLNEAIGGLSGSTYELIRRLEAQGDRLGAQRVMMAAFAEATKAAADNTGLLSRAWSGFWANVSNGADLVGRQIAIAVEGGSDLEERLQTAQKQLQSAKARQPYMPFGLGDYDVDRSQERVDELTKAIERQKKATQEAQDAQKTLAGTKALDAIIPGRADLLQLETFRSTLQQALDTGKATTGTEEALKRINQLIKEGGTEAHNLMLAAQNAFATSTLLPFRAQIERINQAYNERLKTAAPGQVAGLNAAREMEIGAARVAAINNPIRDANLAINEQIANLKVQRDGFMAGTAAAAEMAAKQELLNGYIRQGITVTPELTAAIDSYAKKAGEVAAANEKIQKSQQNIVQGMDEQRSGIQGTLTGIFSDARQGKNPLQGIISSFGRMTDQYVDRMISKPLTESLLGQFGKPGGGLLGDSVSKMFGSAANINTPSATITAATVTVNGAGVGGVGLVGSDGKSLAPGGTYPVPKVDSAPLGDISKTSSMLGGGSRSEVEAYVRQAAALRGIDPDVAARVVKQESGFKIDAQNISSREESYGPMQLNAMGGLGATALKQGIDIRDPSTWRQQIDFGLDTVKKDGWRQWYGARDVGISRWQGIVEPANDLTKNADQASQSVSSLSDKLGKMPDATDSFTDSLSKLGGKLETASFGGSGGGGFSLGSLFGGSSGGGGSFIDAGGASWSANGNVLTPRGPMALSYFAKGGIAQAGRPIVNVIGEGQHNEAVVPLPDGRSIPVSMKVPAMPANTNLPAANANGPISVSHAPTYNITPAQGVTPEQLAAVIDRNNRDFARQLPNMIHGRGGPMDRRAATSR